VKSSKIEKKGKRPLVGKWKKRFPVVADNLDEPGLFAFLDYKSKIHKCNSKRRKNVFTKRFVNSIGADIQPGIFKLRSIPNANNCGTNR
jgi:hypothetical protein